MNHGTLHVILWTSPINTLTIAGPRLKYGVKVRYEDEDAKTEEDFLEVIGFAGNRLLLTVSITPALPSGQRSRTSGKHRGYRE